MTTSEDQSERRERRPRGQPGVLPNIAPKPSAENLPFWEGTAAGKLILPRCRACSYVIWYPRLLCTQCGSDDIEWIEASGRGTIYSCTVTHKGQGAYRDSGPFVLAYVELEEGPRLMTNIVGCEPGSVQIGQAVQVVFHDTGQGSAVPRFQPA